MRHLYDKLGAHRRLEAIDRARALGLLAVPQRALTLIVRYRHARPLLQGDLDRTPLA